MLFISFEFIVGLAHKFIWNVILCFLKLNKNSFELVTILPSALTLCDGKNFSRWHFEIFFLPFLEHRIWFFMQITLGDNLHDVWDPIF